MRPYYNYDSPHVSRNSAVQILMILNISIFALQVLTTSLIKPGAIEKIFALHPQNVVENFWLWQLLTCAFLHSVYDIFHLFWNMVMLFFFGRDVENHLGTKRFWQFYLLCAVFASVIHAVDFYVSQSRGGYALGASGAIMGVLMIAACLYPHRTVLLFFVIPVKMRTLIWIIIGFNLYTALMYRNSQIAASAHLGGLLFGYLYFRYADRIIDKLEKIETKLQARYQHEQNLRAKDLRYEVDRILDKINQQGLQSLTSQEKEFLKQASKKYNKE